MKMKTKVHIIKEMRDEQGHGMWEEVQAIQASPFVYIQSNGSKWAGQEPDDLNLLLKTLGHYTLNIDHWGDCIDANPCQGVRNPARTKASPSQWIDGPRLFTANVTHFSGNFIEVSHVFSVYTNDEGTIKTLTDAIHHNKYYAKTEGNAP